VDKVEVTQKLRTNVLFSHVFMNKIHVKTFIYYLKSFEYFMKESNDMANHVNMIEKIGNRLLTNMS
jgi:hypothetical protein